jgi:ubiquinone/menaquinone biosynthesis C-methylase UbiE
MRIAFARCGVIEAEGLLQRAAVLIRLSGFPDQIPEILPGGRGVRCTITGREFPFRDGVLDLLPDDGQRTFSQRSLDTFLTAWFYDVSRDRILQFAGQPDFRTEVAHIQRDLQIQPGDTVVDLACGHGNFTIEWARMAGSGGLVIGVDISRSMLARAAARIASTGVTNVVLIHGDAHDLPIASGSVRRVNCSGGFHAFPDLSRALQEVARISAPGAILTASTFAENPRHPHPRLRELLKRKLGLHFVPLLWLGEQIERLGYIDYKWTLPKGGFSYTSARRPGGQVSAG